jgi:hypothetical protein
MRLTILVLVVAKNTRALLRIASRLPFRAGIAITGAKALIISPFGAARLKSCPDTKQNPKLKLDKPYPRLEKM